MTTARIQTLETVTLSGRNGAPSIYRSKPFPSSNSSFRIEGRPFFIQTFWKTKQIAFSLESFVAVVLGLSRNVALRDQRCVTFPPPPPPPIKRLRRRLAYRGDKTKIVLLHAISSNSVQWCTRPYLRKVIFLQIFLRWTGPFWWRATWRKYSYSQRGLPIRGPLFRKRALRRWTVMLAWEQSSRMKNDLLWVWQ